jgi:hypothetical protein
MCANYALTFGSIDVLPADVLVNFGPIAPCLPHNIKLVQALDYGVSAGERPEFWFQLERSEESLLPKVLNDNSMW